MVKPKAIEGFLDTELLNAEQAAQVLQLDPGTLAAWRTEKRTKRKGPPFLRLGGKVRYPKHLLIGWAMSHLVVPEKERVA